MHAPATPELQAVLFAFAALLTTRKPTAKASKRCRKRMNRALAHMGRPEVILRADPMLIEQAAGLMHKACRSCGRCAGR